MSTTFMLMNNPMDLIMNLVVNTTVNTDKMALEGAIEKYKVDFDAKLNKPFLLLKCMAVLSSINYVLLQMLKKNLEELTSTEHFFQVVNIFGLTINMAKSKRNH